MAEKSEKNILLLCGYFESVYQQEITRKTKTWVENAANTFQKRLITGLLGNVKSLNIVSAPFIGPWPKAYTDIVFTKFKSKNPNPEFQIKYLPFNNIWGYRNISRAKSLKEEVRRFLNNAPEGKKVILVYSPHTPFLEAAVYGKSLDPTVHICMIVPDLPQYMNLSKDWHPIYDFFKSIDIKRFKKLNQQVDSYMVLTEYMAEELEIGCKPYRVVEGIAMPKVPEECGEKKGKCFAYAGKLMQSFGVKRLLDAFKALEDEDAILDICGGGELRAYVEQEAIKDSRIRYHGLLSAEEAQEIQRQADILINPRINDDEYTKYSFPSKNVEYLQTGKAVIAYMLDGIPEIYRSFFLVPKDNSVAALTKTMQIALLETVEDTRVRTKQAMQYLESRSPNAVGKLLIDMIEHAENK